MVDHILTPTFEVTEITAIMFFLLVPAWLMEVGRAQGNQQHTDLITGQHLLTVCWMTVIKPWDKKVAWGRVSKPAELFRCILQRNKTQLLKALDSPFATGPLANRISRDGHGPATEQMLEGTLDNTIIDKVNQSAEMISSSR